MCMGPFCGIEASFPGVNPVHLTELSPFRREEADVM